MVEWAIWDILKENSLIRLGFGLLSALVLGGLILLLIVILKGRREK